MALLCSRSFAQLAAQQETPPRTPTLTVNARLVVLDVVVTDKAGNPVTDLTRDDFILYEDGALQRTASFEPPSSHVLPKGLAASSELDAIFDPGTPTAFGKSPVTVLVLDQLNTHFADSSFARRSLHDFLAQQPALLDQPTTLITVYDNHFRQVRAYTRDRDALLQALAAEPTHNAWTLDKLGISENGPIQRLDQSLRALEQIAQSSARIAGRKNLVWVGGGLPTLDPTTIDGAEAKKVKDTIQHVTNTLQDTHITVYAVDPTSQAAGMAEITDQTTAEFVATVADATAGATATFDSGEGFENLAPITGGRVVRGRNDVANQIAVLLDTGSSFYTIGYTPASASNSATKYRRIRIDCKRPGLILRTRDGYFAEENRQQLAASSTSISYDLSTAAESAVPLNGLHVTVTRSRSVSSAPDSFALDSFVVHVSAENLTWEPGDDGTSSASVAVLAAYLDKKGKLLTHTLHGMTAHARAGVDLRNAARTADFNFAVNVKAGKAKTLRFIVRDSATGRMGTFDVPVAN